MTSPPELPRSRFADASAACQAVDRCLPLIEPALRDSAVSGLGVLHLVLLDPGLTPADCDYAGAVLHERSIGDRSAWDVDYAAYAHAKARLAWRHGCDSRRVLATPHRLAEADRLVWGGVWLDGIVVAASGAMPAWDEAFSLAVAAQLRAIAYERARAARAVE
ncbi:hypothetical protein [Rubrivivax gelatinosus]|uniref:Uncharacterized protein n=1 Tax=Rubrivivax gelatinosus TaxID=28068 RepID=A0A4R2MDC7_RUBGE|nr:hypothetical protein [Rubrivivax gelatinosus]MBK1686414.1 hypothetical protein [Rubrivivax gelatinosus]TCP04361.1 hypothetical protein EV684_102114 [Rubrivivax gelatinosus]